MALHKNSKTAQGTEINIVSKLNKAAIITLILTVFFLYAHTLGKQSLWFDEALSVSIAAKPLPQLLHTLIYEDVHPPLYFLLLHGWIKLAGNSEWAVRMPSMLAAVVMVPLAFAVVREIFNQEQSMIWAAGTLAASLVGFSPFIAYYAQETRMYSLTATFALATTWAFLKAMRTGMIRWWLIFSASMTMGLYTHYFAAFTAPAFIMYTSCFERKFLRFTMLYTLLAILLYSPWIYPAYLQMRRLRIAPDYWVTTQVHLSQFLHGIWSTFFPTAMHRWGLLLVILGIIFSIQLARYSRSWLSQTIRRSILVFLTFLIPLLLTYVAVKLTPKFVARYAIVAAAPLYICIALVFYGLLKHKLLVARLLFATLVLAAVILSLRSMIAVTEGRENPRDDARGLIAYLSKTVQANDVLLLTENTPHILMYYYQGAAPWYSFHVGQDFVGTANTLNKILASKPRRIWLILWHHEFADPTDMLVTELLRIGHEVEVKQQFRGYWLRAFDILRYDQPIVAYPQPQNTLDANFAPGLACLGFDRLMHDNGRLYYVLYWQAKQPLKRNYSLTLSFQDQDGNEYLRHDQALSTPYFLPPVWPLQTPIRGRVDITLTSDLPPLTYRVYLKVWDPEAQRNLDLIDTNGVPLGQSVLLEELPLSKTNMAPLTAEIKHLVQADLGDHLQLLGFDLIRTAYSHGETLSLTLWWQSTDRPHQDHMAKFRLLDNRGRTVWEMIKPLILAHPATQWQAGEVNRAIYRLGIPSYLPGGEYSLHVGMEDRLIALTSLHIVPREHRYDVPPMQQTLQAQFEQGITLLGYDLHAPVLQPGSTITITLYWQASQAITTSYKVSVQLLSPNLHIAAQDDSIPAHWTYPTTAWLPGEIVSDEHDLTIMPDTMPGNYTLIAVLYHEQRGTRLAVQQGEQHRDHVILATLHVAP